MRFVLAIAWLRWRLLKNSVTSGRRRDAIEQLSRSLALVVPVLIASLSIGTFVAVSIVGFLGGRAIGSGLLDPTTGVFIVRVLLGLMTFAIVSLAIVSPSQGSTSRYTRLLLLPIPRRALHGSEVLASVADPWIAVAAAGLCAVAVGLAAGGRVDGAVAAAAAGVASLAVLVTLGSVASFLVAWLMRSRRRGELFTLVFVIGFSIASLLPALASRSFEEPETAGGSGRGHRAFNIDEFNRSLPAWSRYVPSEVYGGVIRAGLAGDGGRAAAGVGTLVLEAALLFWLSGRVHGRMLDSLEGEGRRRRIEGVPWPRPRVPFLAPAAGAVAWVMYRGALRTVRGRLTVLLPGPMLGLLTLAFRGLPQETWATFAAEQGYVLFGVGLVFTLLSAQPISLNCFGSDRAGLTLQFLAPIGDRDLAWGKAAGLAILVGLGGATCLVCAALVARSGPPAFWLAVAMAGAAAVVLLAPIAIALSALFPVASDLSRTGAGGNPHPVPTIAGMLLMAAFFVPGGALIAAAEFYFRDPWVAPLLMTGWLVVALALGVPGVNLAARLVGRRRENLALVAQGR